MLIRDLKAFLETLTEEQMGCDLVSEMKKTRRRCSSTTSQRSKTATTKASRSWSSEQGDSPQFLHGKGLQGVLCLTRKEN